MTTDQRHLPDCAALMERMQRHVADGDTHADLFRFGVLQAMKWYDNDVAERGPLAGAALFERAPGTTGDRGLDAAFAAMAEWLATRDSWLSPAWAVNLAAPEPWYASNYPGSQAHARATCPALWRRHNVWIGDRALLRPQDSRPEDWPPAS